MASTSLFSGLGLESTLKKIYNVLGRLTYDNSGRLRVYADAAVSINSNQTLATVATYQANISIGDQGKPNTVIAQSVIMIAPTRGNWKS
jgi:hypothetical protein